MAKYILVSLSLILSSLAFAQEDVNINKETGYPVNTTIKGYAKRDRILLGGIYDVSPAQLHEVAGTRTDFGAEVNRSIIRSSGQRSEINNPSGTARVEYGWNHLTLGLAGSYLSGTNSANHGSDEDFKSTKIIPEIADTIARNVTIGAGYEANILDVTEKAQSNNTFSYNIGRPFIGVSYHNPMLEYGVAYYSEAKDSARIDRKQEQTLSLAQTTSADRRSVYIPAETVVYGRGNFSDALSIMSSVSMARYDGNDEGSIALFDKYTPEDRWAGKVVGTYATHARSSLSLAAEYKGGATTAIGADEAGLGYRLANTYGGSLAGVLAIQRRTYLGLLVGYARGERDDRGNDGVRYSSREATTRVAGSITAKL